MLAFTTIIKRQDGTHEVSGDALFRLPPELIDPPRLRSYLAISKPGWSSNEFGYRNYAKMHDNGDLYIYPALIIDEEPKPRKTYPGYKNSFSRSKIELYAEQIADIERNYHEKVNSEFNNLIHDLRRLSTSIYHAAEEGLTHLRYSRMNEVNTRLQNIIATQSMLKIRTDVLDYSGSPDAVVDNEAVPVYRRVDKVVICFSSFAAKKHIKIHLEGASYSHSFGPNIFEIAPYLLIDNAIKYSPNNCDITVNVQDRSYFILVEIKSTGPMINPSEIDEIFKKGYRGKYAKKSGTPGSGIGLFLAESLIRAFKGEIRVETSGKTFIIDDVIMTDVTFTMSVPVHSGGN